MGRVVLTGGESMTGDKDQEGSWKGSWSGETVQEKTPGPTWPEWGNLGGQ